jgi:hypothetical protein
VTIKNWEWEGVQDRVVGFDQHTMMLIKYHTEYHSNVELICVKYKNKTNENTQ